MEFIIIIALAVALVALAFIGLGIQILIKRGGKFPSSLPINIILFMLS